MRGKQSKTRKNKLDPIYKSEIVSKFINCLMKDGEKSVAEKIFYESMKKVETTLKADPMIVFSKAIENVKPKVEVRPRRVGGATYQVPTPTLENRQLALSIRWIINAAREKRGSRAMVDALSEEFIEAYKNTGTAIKKKEETLKMAEANKAFSHLSW